MIKQELHDEHSQVRRGGSGDQGGRQGAGRPASLTFLHQKCGTVAMPDQLAHFGGQLACNSGMISTVRWGGRGGHVAGTCRCCRVVCVYVRVSVRVRVRVCVCVCGEGQHARDQARRGAACMLPHLSACWLLALGGPLLPPPPWGVCCRRHLAWTRWAVH